MRRLLEFQGYTPTLCIQCNGWGEVYTTITRRQETSSKIEICPLCKGAKILYEKSEKGRYAAAKFDFTQLKSMLKFNNKIDEAPLYEELLIRITPSCPESEIIESISVGYFFKKHNAICAMVKGHGSSDGGYFKVTGFKRMEEI